MKYILSFLFSIITVSGFCQAQFPTKGKLYFERKIGQITLMELNQEKGEGDFWVEEFKKSFPRVVTDYYTLDFDEKSSLFKREKENAENKYIEQHLKPNESDYVFKDLEAKKTYMSQVVFEKTYLIADSLSKYTWKIAAETRDIAGFECRKATTKIADSVVVVAFYTDQIPVSTGPGNFNGLPGMILGIAVPRLAYTLFATKLELTSPQLNGAGGAATSKKSVPRSAISADLEKSVKDWGKEGLVIKWFSML
jgi:GLPGLI family protein